MAGDRDRLLPGLGAGPGPVGATYLGGGRCRFCVWAPAARKVEVLVVAPGERRETLVARDRGYHEAILDGVEPGALYLYALDGVKERPDPASRLQPLGVHGPSQVVDTSFPWSDHEWRGLALAQYVIYELHVGTFTPEGTFDGVLKELDTLCDLGITAIELMPIAHFPGARNWGYDAVYPFAVHPVYGGPAALKRLVDACHARGVAVILDVVYNHLGPEGNYLGDFGPYFTDRYRTPWGEAINFDGPESDEVRAFFIQNALMWVTEFHIDALRIDAVHAIFDRSARPFLEELASDVHGAARRAGRHVYVIAESNLNDPRLLRPVPLGGYGMDAQWNDDFHHALHVLLTGERAGYYADFGRLGDLEKAYREGYVLTGEYSLFRRRRHGASARDIPPWQFVVCAQNHDQVGNRVQGDRLSRLITFEGLKLAAGVVLLSPYIPLVFMGEEYGETAPFLYFTDHSDPQLAEAVRRGRRADLSWWPGAEDAPDPQDEGTFLRSRLTPALRNQAPHRVLWEFYRELLRIRRTYPALATLSRTTMDVLGWERERVLLVRRWTEGPQAAGGRPGTRAVTLFNFSTRPTTVTCPLPEGRWVTVVDSADPRWAGPGRTAPQEVYSSGQASLAVAPTAFVLLAG